MHKHITALLLIFAWLSTHAQLVPKDALPEKVADGYQFTEGPALGPDGCIYFTDIPAELILKFDPKTGETKTVVERSGNANGLMFDKDGKLYACRRGARELSGVFLSGENWLFTHAAPKAYEGKKLNSPNDLAIDKAGNLYFTDPRYGNRDSMEMDVDGVYFRDVETKKLPVGDAKDEDGNQGFAEVWKPLVRIDAELQRPNGIVLSPDESILYVADHYANWVYAYDIESPGKVKNKRKFVQLNNGEGKGSDGMCVDKQGRLYATGHEKIWVFEPTGELVATFQVGEQITNCTFGADGKTLYITANHGLYRIELNTDAKLEHAEKE